MSDQPQEPRDILEGEMSDMARGDDTAQLAKEIIAMRRLHDFNRRLQLATDLQTALEEVLGASIALLSADKGNIQLYDPAAGSLRIVVHRGFDKEFLEAFTCVDASDPTACGRALKARKRIVIEDVEMDPLYEPYRKVAASAGYRGVQSTPFFDPTGEPLGILSTHFHKPHRPADYELRILDLYTRFAANYLERARAGEALRASEERFRMLADNISQLAWMADEKGWIFWYNKRWYEYTGSTLEEMQGWGWKKVHHPDHVERVVERVQRSWDTGEPWEDTFPLRGADGKYRWFLSRALPIQNAEGRVFRWFGTNTDVTELREAEEKLRLQAEELEKRVAERTRELQQANGALLRDMEERQKLEEQLLQSRKMESIGTLAGGIAHDFNNVLNIIQGYTFVLRDHAAQNKDMKESLNIIEQSVQRGAALVQQILTFARKSSAHFEPVNVNLLIETAIGLIGQTFPKTIELSSSLDPDVAPIMADKNQIQQALLNLCLNARDAMPNGGKLLFETGVIDGTTLQRLGEAKEKRYVSIHITDTGTGMDEKLQRRIFEPFFTTKDKGVGTGLGLSVVYGIVKNHNGVIHLDSQPRSGTSFRLHFPAVDGDLTAKEAVALDFSDVAAAREISATVLLVEDEKRMLDLLDKILLRHGYKVLKASDGETAVEVYRRNRDKIDVVLLDMGLPKMAGQEVLLKLKQENPAVKAVVASGYLEPELRSELKRAGVDYFLHKPYKSDEVVKTLGSLTARE